MNEYGGYQQQKRLNQIAPTSIFHQPPNSVSRMSRPPTSTVRNSKLSEMNDRLSQSNERIKKTQRRRSRKIFQDYSSNRSNRSLSSKSNKNPQPKFSLSGSGNAWVNNPINEKLAQIKDYRESRSRENRSRKNSAEYTPVNLMDRARNVQSHISSPPFIPAANTHVRNQVPVMFNYSNGRSPVSSFPTMDVRPVQRLQNQEIKKYTTLPPYSPMMIPNRNTQYIAIDNSKPIVYRSQMTVNSSSAYNSYKPTDLLLSSSEYNKDSHNLATMRNQEIFAHHAGKPSYNPQRQHDAQVKVGNIYSQEEKQFSEENNSDVEFPQLNKVHIQNKYKIATNPPDSQYDDDLDFSDPIHHQDGERFFDLDRSHKKSASIKLKIAANSPGDLYSLPHSLQVSHSQVPKGSNPSKVGLKDRVVEMLTRLNQDGVMVTAVLVGLGILLVIFQAAR